MGSATRWAAERLARAASAALDRPRRRVPLRWLIAGCYAPVLAGALAALGSLIYLQVEAHLWRAGETRLRYQIESKWNRQPITRQTPGTPRLPALPGFPGWAPDLARELSTADVNVRVLLPDGSPLADQGGPPSVPPVEPGRVVPIRATLKTPLTAIGGMAELLRTGTDAGQPGQRELAVRTIERQVDRMNRLVADLLALSRAEEGRAAERLPVDLVALAEDVGQEARVLAPRHAIALALEGPLATVGDREQLRRVLRNLVDNARQHTPPGGAISLAGTREGDWAIVTVRDSGRGISPQHLPHVFERFYRADPSRARRTGGSGLGLAIVRSIVERHGGTVEVESAPGHGTAVTLRLPAANL